MKKKTEITQLELIRIARRKLPPSTKVIPDKREKIKKRIEREDANADIQESTKRSN